jgi:hypothetical protein
MHPGHPRWLEFYERLAGPGYVNFHSVNDETAWDCKSGRDKSHAIRLLTEMGFTVQQIVETCVYFEDHGGMCDCEILWNVNPREPRRRNTGPNPKKNGRSMLSAMLARMAEVAETDEGKAMRISQIGAAFTGKKSKEELAQVIQTMPEADIKLLREFIPQEFQGPLEAFLAEAKAVVQ